MVQKKVNIALLQMSSVIGDIEANIKKDKEILEEVLTHLRGMRDTWKEVMKKSMNA